MKKYFIQIFGCQMNISDSERIALFLEQQGYEPIKKTDLSAETLAKADLIVTVACSVRQSAIDRIFGMQPKIHKLKILNPKLKIVLTGCILKSDKLKFEKIFDEVSTIQNFFRSTLFHDRKKKYIKNYLELQPKYSDPANKETNKKSALIPIMTGCNNFCTYCAVPHTRGREISRPAKNIIREIKSLIEKGYKEIVLLGQNVNSYKSKSITFPILLKMIIDIPGNFTIKFLTSHPKDFSNKLIDVIAKSPKISKEIHLPVQSGDNEILRKMNRNYTREHYLKLINKIKAKIPEAKFTTDIIVGFPGETKKQFENTIKLFKKVNFNLAYINKYSTRPGTVAAKFKDNISWNEKVRRWNVLNKIANTSKTKNKIIVILGPTASGKSDLAVKIAQKFNGEIISADSRQVYKGMDIGTGKITQKEMQNTPHYMIDIVNPKKQFSVGEYKRKAEKIIQQIIKNKKTPIICGGTGFYIQALTNNIPIPKVKPDWKLRNKLEKKTNKELFIQLKKLDPERAKNIDAKNKRRLIRAIEIVLKTGKPVPNYFAQNRFALNKNVLYLGIKKSIPELKKLIYKRLIKRINIGMIEEIKKLHNQGVSWKRLDDFGLEYRYVARYLQEILTKEQMIEQLKRQIINFAKRQMTWFNKYPGNKIHWINTLAEANKLIKQFLNN